MSQRDKKVLLKRFEAAQETLSRLKPRIYTPSLIKANMATAKIVSASELEYFVLSAENNVANFQRRTENRASKPAASDTDISQEGL